MRAPYAFSVSIVVVIVPIIIVWEARLGPKGDLFWRGLDAALLPVHTQSFVFPQTPASNEPTRIVIVIVFVIVFVFVIVIVIAISCRCTPSHLYSHKHRHQMNPRALSQTSMNVHLPENFRAFPTCKLLCRLIFSHPPSSESFMGCPVLPVLQDIHTALLNMVSHSEFILDNFAPFQDKTHHISTYRRHF